MPTHSCLSGWTFSGRLRPALRLRDRRRRWRVPELPRDTRSTFRSVPELRAALVHSRNPSRESAVNKLATGLFLSATFAVAIAGAKPVTTSAQKTKVDKETPAQPVDLTKFYQAPASQFDKSKTHAWRIVPRG